VEDKLALGTEWKGADNPVAPDAYVFTSDTGTRMDPDNKYRAFQRACKRAEFGERQTFHALRHDFASLLARLGVPLRMAMDMLGHSKELMTIYYQHASDADRREAAGKVDGWLRAAGHGA
jgi:integrase